MADSCTPCQYHLRIDIDQLHSAPINEYFGSAWDAALDKLMKSDYPQMLITRG